MKIISALLFLLLASQTSAQISWSSPVSIAANSYSNLHPRIVLDRSGDPMILWGKISNKATYFSKWNGTTFSTPVMVNPMSIPVFTDSWAGPDITSFGDTVYVVYKHTPEDQNNIYISRSFNGGQSFLTPVQVDGFLGDSLSRFPTVTTDALGNPVVAFMKFNSSFGDARYVVAKSNDFGNSFSADVPSGNYSGGDACDCCPASIVSSENKMAVLYRDNLSNIRNIWTGISTDGGSSFQNGMQLDFTDWMIMGCPSTGPDGFIVGDSLYSVFMSQGSNKALIYLSKGSLTTKSAYAAPITGSFPGLSLQNYPRVSNNGKYAVAAWRQGSFSSSKVAVVFTDDISKGFPSNYDSIGVGNVLNVDVVMGNNEVHVVWQNDNTGTVMYQKGTFSNTTGFEKEKSKNSIVLYPNPANKEVFIGSANITRCTLTDISGKQFDLRVLKTGFESKLDLSNLKQGIYFVMITEDSQVYWSKLVIQ